jgi:hypothetical protein
MPVRLAFLRHAASVRPEPGSNSPTKVEGQKQRRKGTSLQRSSPPKLSRRSQDLERSFGESPTTATPTNLAAAKLKSLTDKHFAVPLFGFQGACSAPLKAGACAFRQTNGARFRQRHTLLYRSPRNFARLFYFTALPSREGWQSSEHNSLYRGLRNFARLFCFTALPQNRVVKQRRK